MMPQVDLETLVSACAGGSCDGKIACETLAGNGDGNGDGDASHAQDPGQNPDFPPDSFWLSKEAEFDWFDRNAFLERKESGKANSANLNPSSNSNSQRFSVARKHKASIIGLPKTQKSSFVDANYRKKTKPENTRLFPKRTGSVGKSGPNVIEPCSPKVSCMGRVRSKKDRNRRLKKQQRSREPKPAKAKPEGKRKTGFLASFRCIFRTRCQSQRGISVDDSFTGSPRKGSAVAVSHDIRERLPAVDLDVPSSESLPRKSVSEFEPVGLGSMKRFASGRKSDAWADDVA